MHSFCQVGCYLSRSQTHRQSDSERRLTFVRPTDRPKVFWSISWPETASTRLLRHKHTELINFLIMLFDQWLLWSDYDQNFKWVTTGPFKVIWPLVGKANFSETQNKVDEDTGTVMSENCRPRKSWGVRLKSKCYHDDHDDGDNGHDGHDDNDEIQRNSCLGWFLSDLVFNGSQWRL